MSKEINKDSILCKTEDENAPAPCSAYDKENGTCKDTGVGCDGCYANSMQNSMID